MTIVLQFGTQSPNLICPELLLYIVIFCSNSSLVISFETFEYGTFIIFHFQFNSVFSNYLDNIPLKSPPVIDENAH